MNQQQYEKVRDGRGFFAALDQSGGSTPKALAHYGIEPDQYSGDDEMFDAMHAMRTRMITSPCFGGDRILGAILFEGTMDRDIDGKGSAEYLWTEKQDGAEDPITAEARTRDHPPPHRVHGV